MYVQSESIVRVNARCICLVKLKKQVCCIIGKLYMSSKFTQGKLAVRIMYLQKKKQERKTRHTFKIVVVNIFQFISKHHMLGIKILLTNFKKL